jgi:hypothetical protein
MDFRHKTIFLIVIFWVSDRSFGSTTLLTGMTGISLHMQIASDFSVTWQFLSKRKIVFLLRIKLHALIRLGVSPPRSTVWVSTKPVITEKILPGQGLNPGLPNDTTVRYPLLHELMLNTKRIITLDPLDELQRSGINYFGQ